MDQKADSPQISGFPMGIPTFNYLVQNLEYMINTASDQHCDAHHATVERNFVGEDCPIENWHSHRQFLVRGTKRQVIIDGVIGTP